MTRFRTIATVALLSFACPAVRAADFYVAPKGNDAWSGKRAEPNAARSDGPFASLARAQLAVRGVKAREPVTVHLRGGVYRLEKTLEFTPQDSGTKDCPITYVACAGEKPVISGGRAIAGWSKAERGLWQATVPGVREGTWRFHQLFVNGQRRTRARTPNKGFLYTEGIIKPFDRSKWYASGVDAKSGFRYREGDIKDWRNGTDALIVVYHSWTTSIHSITSIDPTERIVRLAPPSAWPIGYWWEYNTRYHVENVPEALDSLGEWYLDRSTGVLSYWPLPGENMATAEVIAPVVRQTLVAFKGEPAAKKPIEYLCFRGLSFQHTDCYIAPDMELDHQGATGQKPLVAAAGLRHAVFEDCELAHAGENGIWLAAGCTDNVVRRCQIHDLGASAVFIGVTSDKGAPETAVLRNTVDNCFIHDGSHIFRGSQGVWIGKASSNRVTHNEIADFHHLGVSVGYSWGYAPSTANNNLIAFNRIHHICNGYFSDGGGIYTLGISPGTVIRNNVVHDVIPTPLMPDGGCGIYHDEGSTGILVENNVVYNVGIPFHQHYGKQNIARNNILAFERKSPISCARKEDHLSYTFEGNIVLSRGGQATSDRYSPLKCNTAFQRNVYWDTSGKPPTFSGLSFAQWQATGRDRDSRIADPQFVDAQHYDFRLKPSSPALAMGFTPIDTTQAGLYGDRPWVAGPSQVRREPLAELPPPPPPPPPRPFREDFESIEPGREPPGFSLSPPDRPDLVSVTAEVAASGKHSLKFVDAPGLAHEWQPHLYFRPGNYAAGRVRFSCDLMNSARQPSECFIALRQWDEQPYREGPSLTLRADGTLSAAGKTLARLPLGKWIHLDIQLDLGAKQTAQPPKTYRLEVRVEGEQPLVFAAVPYLHADFARLTWIGFSSSGRPGAVFYVDNMQVERSGEASPARASRAAPNVVLILADDQGWGDLSIHGNRNLQTPHIDSLAHDGAIFDRFYVCPLCAPTRAELLTGRYHPRGGVHGVTTGAERLNLDERTFADAFLAASYATAAFGKWHNGTQYPYHPNGRGFQEYYGFCSGHWGHYFDPLLEHNGQLVHGKGFIIDDLTDHALAFIEQNRDRPFFCYLPYNTPHTPWQVPDRFFDKFRDHPLPMRCREAQKEQLDQTRCALAMCENIDWNVGRVLDRLGQLGLADNTIVLYLSDNGPNSWRWNGGMKGRKGSTDEGGVRVPCLVRWPGHIRPGTKITHIAGAIDLMPTLTDLAGVRCAPAKPLDGVSLKPLLVGSSQPWPERMIFSHNFGQVSVRTQQYRLDNAGRLFDMIADPGQDRDLSRQQPDVAARLRAAVAAWRAEVLPAIEHDDRPFPVGYQAFPTTFLPARDGVPAGGIERSSKAPNCSYFTRWTSTQGAITWDIEVATTGTYKATVFYTCPKSDVGSTVELTFAAARVRAKVTEPHDPPAIGAAADRCPRAGESLVKEFRPLRLGSLRLEKGRGPLLLHALEMPGSQVMEVRAVELRME